MCIRELRQALEDDAQAPRFIETVRCRGNRFVAKVTVVYRPDFHRRSAFTLTIPAA